MSKIICIYHGIDQDGYSSAAIVKSKFPSAELIGWNYGMPVPKIEPNCIVIICDISFPMHKMQEIADISETFIWIDHHKSSIENYNIYKKYNKNFWVVILPKDGKQLSACELTWAYFNSKPAPEAIRLIGSFDTYRHKGTAEEERVMNFQNAADECVMNPRQAAIYLHMKPDVIDNWVHVGGLIQQKKNIEAKETYKTGKSATIDGYKFIMFADDRFNPTNFGIDYAKDGYDGSGSYHKDEQGIWRLSLYSNKSTVDCSAICKKFGGGGHKGASGCEPTKEVLDGILNNKYAKI